MADGQEIKTRVSSVMDDPSARAIARVYATALVDAAESAGVAVTLDELASFLDDVLEAHPDFHSILVGMAVGRDQKVAMIERVVGPVGSPVLTSFLTTLARHERLELLPLVLDEARLIENRRGGRKSVQVTAPAALDSDARLGLPIHSDPGNPHRFFVDRWAGDPGGQYGVRQFIADPHQTVAGPDAREEPP